MFGLDKVRNRLYNDTIDSFGVGHTSYTAILGVDVCFGSEEYPFVSPQKAACLAACRQIFQNIESRKEVNWKEEVKVFLDLMHATPLIRTRSKTGGHGNPTTVYVRPHPGTVVRLASPVYCLVVRVMCVAPMTTRRRPKPPRAFSTCFTFLVSA